MRHYTYNMVGRGPKPKRIIDETWRSELAYAIGLLATDGCLSSDGLLVDLTSNDKEQLENYAKCLGINKKYKIDLKSAGKGRTSLRIQFKNRIFYNFLLSIGLTKKKSLTLGKLKIPNKYFFDFLRGCFDGDGHSYSYWDPRWKSSFMFYMGFTSASKNFIKWIREEINKKLNIKGHVVCTIRKNPYYQLKYAKRDAVEIINKMYYNPRVVHLSRKYKKIKKTLKINEKQQIKYL